MDKREKRPNFKEVCLVGKGKSLDTFDFSLINIPIIAINQSAMTVPCQYMCCINQSILPMLKKQLDKSIEVWYNESYGDYGFENQYRYKMHKEISVETSTVVTTLQLLKYFGCETVHMIAFDAMCGVLEIAESVKEFIIGQPCVNNYIQITADTLNMLNILGLKPVWHNANY